MPRKQNLTRRRFIQHAALAGKDFADFQRPAKSIPDSIGHHTEWLNACKTGAATTCHFGYSGYRAGKRIEWDAKAMRIRNAPEAEPFLGREYRKGWQLG